MINTGGLVHHQPSALPVVNATSTASNTGCVSVQFFHGFLDGTDVALIHHHQQHHQQQPQQVPLSQMLHTQMPGFFSFVSHHTYVHFFHHFIQSSFFFSIIF